MKLLKNMNSDHRISKILELVYALAAGNLSARCSLNKKGDELDAIIGGLNMLAEELQASATETDIARKKLETEKEKFQALLEQIPYGIMAFDEEGTHHYINDRFIEMFGYPLQEIPDSMAWLKKGFPGKMYRNRILSYWMNYINNQETTNFKPRVFKTTCRDGTVKEVLISIIKVEKDNYLSIYEDVTEKRLLEKRLVQAQKMEAIGTLAGGVAHDLNNILSGIVSYPDLLLMDLSDDSPLKGPILTIRQSGQKAATIVQDLLTLARRGVSISQVLNLNEIIEAYRKSPEYHRLLSFHPHVDIEFQLAKNLLNIKGSPVHLSKMLMNLASNAFEAIHTKGMVTIATENRYIDMQKGMHDELTEGEYILLSVSDDGIGITMDELNNIYEPFYTKKVMGRSGTGLGMAVVWSTVKDHNGNIKAYSIEGKGTTFEVYLPATRLQIETVGEIRLEEYLGKGETILIVDDVQEQRTIASGILSRLNYTVDAVSSGELAIEYLREKTADLVILDMIMPPGMDGLDTYITIKKMDRDIKAIVASGYSETDRVKNALKQGVHEYVKKPYSMETIGMAVKKVLAS